MGEYAKDASDNEITIITGADGKYYTDKLPYGYYTVEAVKDGFATAYVNIISINDDTAAMGQDVVFVPEASGNDFRVTLEWESHPRDEDAHIVGDLPDDFHVYYNNKVALFGDTTVATLDQDDQNGNGFETITLTVNPSGVYKYYVHHYAGEESLSTSNAIVKVYQGGVLIKQYNVPVDQGTEKYWNVFNIVNGEVVTVNLILDHVVN